jgi:hypothetical protein
MKKIQFPSKIRIHINLKKDGKFLGFGTSPYTDWKIIFISFVILSLVVILTSVYIFIKIDKGEIFEITRSGTEEETSLDIEMLRKATSYYQQKDAQFERIISSSSKDNQIQTTATTSTKTIEPFGSPE